MIDQKKIELKWVVIWKDEVRYSSENIIECAMFMMKYHPKDSCIKHAYFYEGEFDKVQQRALLNDKLNLLINENKELWSIVESKVKNGA